MNFEQIQRKLKRVRDQSIASDRPAKKRRSKDEIKLLELPPELVTRIIRKIPPDTLPTALQVCKLFAVIGNQDKIKYRYISTRFKLSDKDGFKKLVEQKGQFVKSLRICEKHGLRFVTDLALKNCPNLRTLINKSNSAITQPFPKLEHITVTLSALNAGQPLHEVRSLRVLKELYFESCTVQLDQKLMSNLVRLYWGPSCPLPSGFALLTNLRYLSLPRMQRLTKADLDAIALLCKHLKSLALNLPSLEADPVLSLDDITGPHLYELRLRNVVVSQRSAESLPRTFPNLQILDLSRTVHHPPVKSISRWRLYSLTWIDLNLTDEFETVKLPHLLHLNVKKNSAVTGRAFKGMVKRFPRLEYFAASGCQQLGPDLLVELLACRGLKELHLTRTAVTPFSLKQYFSNGGGLRLRVLAATSISGDCDDACLNALACPLLRELRLSTSSAASTAGLLGLRRLKRLKRLYLGTRAMFKQVLNSLEEAGIALLAEDPDDQ